MNDLNNEMSVGDALAQEDTAQKHVHIDDDGVYHITIDDFTSGVRLDQILARAIADMSRSRLKKLIDNGEVKVNGVLCTTPSRKTEIDDKIVLKVPPPVEWYPEPENIPLDVVYEDDDLLVINKQVGLVVHPGAGNKMGTLVSALLYHCGDSLSGIGGVLRPGIVHRLDKDTSGLMVVAKNDQSHQGLSAQFSDRSLSRKYKALVLGVPMPPKGTVDLPIARHHKNRLLMAINKNHGRSAKTHYKVIGRFGEQFSLVECTLESGRTHQIRVHMAAVHHPLIGDKAYGPQATAVRSALKKAGHDQDEDVAVIKMMNFPRQALHAYALSFIHPRSGQRVSFTADLPADFQDMIDCL